MGEKKAQKFKETYTVPGAQAEDGTTGTLVFTVMAGGNAHAEFQPDEGQQSEPKPSQEEDAPHPEQQPVDPQAAGDPTATGEQGETG